MTCAILLMLALQRSPGAVGNRIPAGTVQTAITTLTRRLPYLDLAVPIHAVTRQYSNTGNRQSQLRPAGPS